MCARVAQAGVPTDVSCAYSSCTVGCRDMHSCQSSCAVLCPDSPISECTAAAGCRLRWLLLNRVQRPVQTSGKVKLVLRFKLRGLSAPPCVGASQSSCHANETQFSFIRCSGIDSRFGQCVEVLSIGLEQLRQHLGSLASLPCRPQNECSKRNEPSQDCR